MQRCWCLDVLGKFDSYCDFSDSLKLTGYFEVYRFVTIQSSCGATYDIDDCEEAANKMARNGFELVQVYQSSTWGCSIDQGCCMGKKSVLVMVFKSRH